uniref:jeltraxin-like n=1 Tax=Semicossyphus pulcher TaxID=241346 RepID=UPI0037E99C58
MARMKLLYAPMMMVLLIINPGLTSTSPPAKKSGKDLNGKMFTLTPVKGGVSFYDPSFPPAPTSWPVPTPFRTSRYNTSRPTISSPTPTTGGVSVCLRFLLEKNSQPTLFTLSPSTSPLTLRVYSPGRYALIFSSRSGNLYLQPDIGLWANIHPEIWNRVCVTVDTMNNVVQMFNNNYMSVRKMLSAQYVWSGEAVIDVPGFQGQVTSVQVWDYPLLYKEVFHYMNSGRSSPGNVLAWSSICYSLRGNTLLENVYEQLMLQRKSATPRRNAGKKSLSQVGKG